MNQPYIPSAHDLIDMSIWSLEEHVAELREKMSRMTPEQQAAFIRICSNIASMREAA